MNGQKSLSIKALTAKLLREAEEPFFYLAPDIVGSVNNARHDTNKKRLVIDFNTVDNHNMQLMVPHKFFVDWKAKEAPDTGVIKAFLLKFLENSRAAMEQDSLDEMVDDEGNLFGDLPDDDKPANIRGNPGYGNTKNSSAGRGQYAAQFTRLISPLGYGGVVW